MTCAIAWGRCSPIGLLVVMSVVVVLVLMLFIFPVDSFGFDHFSWNVFVTFLSCATLRYFTWFTKQIPPPPPGHSKNAPASPLKGQVARVISLSAVMFQRSDFEAKEETFLNSQLDATIIILLKISISSTCFGR